MHISSVMLNMGSPLQAFYRVCVTFARRIYWWRHRNYVYNILRECSTTLQSSSIYFKSKFTTNLAVATQVDLLLCIHIVFTLTPVLLHTFLPFMNAIHHIYLINRHERKGRQETGLIWLPNKSRIECVDCRVCAGLNNGGQINECHYTLGKITIASIQTSAITHIRVCELQSLQKSYTKTLIRHKDCFRFGFGP